MSYIDMSSGFIYKKPLFQSKLDQLVENDNVLKEKSIPDSTKVVFNQTSVPTGYTQDISNNGKSLRVVSGSGGGTGGSFDISGTISLAHSAHTVSNEQHDHDGSSHIHIGDSTNISTDLTGSDDYAFVSPSSAAVNARLDAAASSFNVLNGQLDGTTSGAFANNTAQNHGGSTTVSALTDISFVYTDVLIGNKAVSPYTFTDLSSEFDHNDPVNFDPFSQLNDNDLYLEEALFRSGTNCLFPGSVPTGWTLDSGFASNGALRVVSGTGGASSGSKLLNSNIVLNHSHTLSTDVNHDHSINNHRHDWATVSASDVNGSTTNDLYQVAGDGTLERFNATGSNVSVVTGRTDSDGGGGTIVSAGSHTHNLGSSLSNTVFKTLRTIAATRNPTGSSATFSDQSASLINQKLASYQRLNQLGANDKYIQYHQIPSGAYMFFYQSSAPTGWTKAVTDNDALVMSSLSSGGLASGIDSISAGLTLQHSHTIQSGGAHTHSISNHTHTLETTTQSVGSSTGEFLMQGGTAGGGGTSVALRNKALPTTGTPQPFQQNTFTNTSGATTNSDSHDHGGATGNLLSDIIIAYQDVIRCQKD